MPNFAEPSEAVEACDCCRLLGHSDESLLREGKVFVGTLSRTVVENYR